MGLFCARFVVSFFGTTVVVVAVVAAAQPIKVSPQEIDGDLRLNDGASSRLARIGSRSISKISAYLISLDWRIENNVHTRHKSDVSPEKRRLACCWW